MGFSASKNKNSLLRVFSEVLLKVIFFFNFLDSEKGISPKCLGLFFST